MKFLVLTFLLFSSILSFAQPDSVRVIEPDRETSFENYELLILAIVGLLLLMGIRYWFRRSRKH